jgi:7-cyano-7-deazaguanine synthase
MIGKPGDTVRFEPANDPESDGVAIVSGGMDSITMVYWLAKRDYQPHLLSFDYGQRHRKELDFALACAERLQLRWSLIDLSSITELISNSALTSPPRLDFLADPNISGLAGKHWQSPEKKIEVPEGHYAKDNMALTVVPNRNMMMLSIAAAVAVNAKYKYVAAGMHAGDHSQYPDCRPVFIDSIWDTIVTANEGFIDRNFVITTPFLHATKNDIAQEAYKLDVPLHMTWSCYRGGELHCGRCGTCVERLEAIASITSEYHGHPKEFDKTEYEDKEFWRTAVAEYKHSRDDGIEEFSQGRN